jgi:hypothetical protein
MVKFFLLALIFVLTSCAHSVHQLHMGDFETPKSIKSGKWITAKAEQMVILGFVSDTNYVNEARSKLIAKCPKGNIQAVSTRYSTSLGFFSWYNKILMQGLCTK